MTDQHQGNSVADITDRIVQNIPNSILDLDEPEAAPETEAPEAEEVSTPEQEPEKDEAGEEEETTETDEKPEVEEEPETDEPASEDDDPVFEITLPDGQTEEVSVSKLADGYLKGREVETMKAETAAVRQDLERRMQELPSLISQKVMEEQNRLAQAIQQWSVANPDIPPPSLDLLDENSPEYNPTLYYRQKEQREIRHAKAQEAARQLQAIAQEREQQQAAIEAQERDKLFAAWPELKDSAAQQRLFDKAGEYYGLAREEVAGIQNHKAFLVLRDALAHREMKAKAPEVRQKAKAPKPKPVKPGVRKTAGDVKRAELTDMQKRLKKTGSVDDAIALFEKRLPGGIL